MPGLLLLAACATVPGSDYVSGAPICASGTMSVHADFPSAGQHDCAIDPDGTITLAVHPEPSSSGPINPSPWYAFAIRSSHAAGATVRLDYGTYEHRYSPWLSRDGKTWKRFDESAVSLSDDEHLADIRLDVVRGQNLVAAHPLLASETVLREARQTALAFGLEETVYGTSIEGRDLVAYTKGATGASRVIVAMTRQHPPEITGAEAYRIFLDVLLSKAPPDFWNDHLLIAVPLPNPDGVENGHWRLNAGGVDINRDWFTQEQPEIVTLTRYLESTVDGRRTIAFFDFHSTWRTLIYTPPFENASPDAALLVQLEEALDDPDCTQPDWITGHNDTSGTSKAWALETLGAPGITVELGDDESADAVQCTATRIAEELIRYAAGITSAPD